MINRLRIAHWTLVAVAAASTLAVVHAGWTLTQTNKVNNFISSPADYAQIPEHEKALFAKAFSDVSLGQNEEALERLTAALVTKDVELEAAAYFNRANVHMREVLSLPPENTGRVALVGLAKQDYRNALLINPSLWDARYNLEYALNMVPEEPGSLSRSSHEKGHATVIVKVVGFRVDLP